MELIYCGAHPTNLTLSASVDQGSKNGSSRINFDANRDESNTRYNLYLDSALNRLDLDDSTGIPS